VAAHLEPEILLIDEVLAVGDVAFQKKCLGKMGDVASTGRTILFVSHNMNAIQRLCPKSVILDQGRLVAHATTSEAIARYQCKGVQTVAPGTWIDVSLLDRLGTGEARFLGISYCCPSDAGAGDQPYPDGPIEFALRVVSDAKRDVRSLAVTLYDQNGHKLINPDTVSVGELISLKKGENLVRIKIRELHLNPGLYMLGLWLADPPFAVYDFLESSLQIEVVARGEYELGTRPLADGSVTCSYEIEQVG
jgi:lipopolysaccharide transport system ATP-binding protein